jgi:hypothetical protein
MPSNEIRRVEVIFMCMNYKGIDYHYAFEFKIPIENSSYDRIMNVVISNYREETYDFSGLCLENELSVVSDEKMLFAAFFNIVDSIVKITTECESEYFKKNGNYPTPLLSVKDEAFLKKFNNYKQAKKSLDYYERLKIAFEKSSSKSNKIKIDNIVFKPNIPDIIEIQNVVFFNYLVQTKEVPIRDTNYFRL